MRKNKKDIIGKKAVSYKETGDKAIAESKYVSSLGDLLQICNVDLNIWEVERYEINKWDVTLKDDSGPTQKQNFQIKAWLKKKTLIIDYEKFRKELIEDVKKKSPTTKRINYNKYLTKDKNLLTVNIFDLHFDKVSWHEEVNENSDSKIASKKFLNGIEGLLSKAHGYKIDKILFPIGNDFFNSDTAYPYTQTTKGTPQESDLRWQKTFRTGRILLSNAIDLLSQIAPVDVIGIPGNHDLQRSFMITEALFCKYENNKNIYVNNSANIRKYYHYGKNLFGFTHGDKEKVAELHNLMASEQPELWAKSYFRQWFLGHLHHEKVIQHISTQDYRGVIISYLPSLTSSDAWHHSKGYVGSIKGCKAYLHSYIDGQVAEFSNNLSPNYLL